MAPSRDLKWKHQADGCPACIISQITSDLQILLDLRWAFRSRATRAHVAKYGNPRLEGWADVWITNIARYVEERTGTSIDLDVLFVENEGEAILLKKARAEAASLKQQKHNYRKTGPGQAAFVTQANYDYSYPIRQSPHKIQPEEYVGDTNEARLEEMDPHEALKSTPYLPQPVYKPPDVTQSVMTMETVSGDRSTKGFSPYFPNERVSVDLVLDDRLPAVSEENEAETEYVPPRSMWTNDPSRPDEPANASSTVLGQSAGIRSGTRPSRDASKESWEKSTASIASNASWETEKCLPTDPRASVYPTSETTPIRSKLVSPSQSWMSLSTVAQQTHNTKPGHRRKRPTSIVPLQSEQARTYTNLIHRPPFSETNAALAPQPIAEQVRGSPAKASIPHRMTATQSFLTLLEQVSRPTDSSQKSMPENRNNISATRTSLADISNDPAQQSPPGPSSRHSSSKRERSDSTQRFDQTYDEFVSSYMTPERSSSSSVRSGSSSVYSQPGTEHDAYVDRMVEEVTRGTQLHDEYDADAVNEILKRRNTTSTNRTQRSYTSSMVTPALTSTSTLSSQSSTETLIPPPSQSDRKGKGKAVQNTKTSPSSSERSADTTWSLGYKTDIRDRGDLDWYYDEKGRKTRK